jgi:hypothetical protein
VTTRALAKSLLASSIEQLRDVASSELKRIDQTPREIHFLGLTTYLDSTINVVREKTNTFGKPLAKEGILRSFVLEKNEDFEPPRSNS